MELTNLLISSQLAFAAIFAINFPVSPHVIAKALSRLRIFPDTHQPLCDPAERFIAVLRNQNREEIGLFKITDTTYTRAFIFQIKVVASSFDFIKWSNLHPFFQRLQKHREKKLVHLINNNNFPFILLSLSFITFIIC